MDDGFLALLKSIKFNTFLQCLNSMHPKIKFTEEKAEFLTINGLKTQRLNFLDVTILLNENNLLETDVYYKPTNRHDYLNYTSSHPEHTKRNIPFNLAKRIICFVSNEIRMHERLDELRKFLLKCEYPKDVIDKGFFNAKLQGPAPQSTNSHDMIPLVTTNYSNLQVNNVLRKAKFYLANTPSDDLKESFQDCKFFISNRQPKNLLLRLLSPSVFGQQAMRNTNDENLIVKCNDIRCKICSMYLQCVDSFPTATGKTWEIKCKMSCNSKNIIYFLTCNRCNGNVSYIGKTVNLRRRTNGHISSCRTGNGSDIFDRHVYNCIQGPHVEPYFKLFLMMKTEERSLLTYESHFHSLGYDTMNRP